MGYSPTLHTGSNKPLGLGNGGAVDARSYFYDDANAIYRTYANTGEVLSYLLPVKYRTGNFSIFVKNGTLVEEWWFRDGTADNQLILKQGGAGSETQAGVVQLATDAEMKLTSAVAEDAKVSSRLKIFNWWVWLRTVAWTISARWTFGILRLTNTTNTTPGAGDLWLQWP